MSKQENEWSEILGYDNSLCKNVLYSYYLREEIHKLINLDFSFTQAALLLKPFSQK